MDGEPWHFTSYPSVTGRFIALAKKGPFVTGNVLTEPGDVWFESADTAEAALAKLRQEVMN